MRQLSVYPVDTTGWVKFVSMKGKEMSERALMAETALKAFIQARVDAGEDYANEEEQSQISDLLTDLLYLAHENGHNAVGLLTTAETSFNIESTEENEEELVVDHLCRNPHCCNPQHLKVIPQKES